MTGFFDRLDGPKTERVGVHYAVAAIKGVVLGLWTDVQARDSIDAILAQKGYPVLSGAELTDLAAIIAKAVGQSTKPNALEYGEKIGALFLAAEASQITEAAWRTGLGI